jgi:hypothetical protein
VIGEHDHVKLAKLLVDSIQAGLAASTRLWKDDQHDTNWAALAAGGEDEELKKELGTLRGLGLRISLFSDVSLALSWSHPRIATAFLKAWNAKTGSTIEDLGKLHQACFVQHVKLKSPPKPASTSNTEKTTGSETVVTSGPEVLETVTPTLGVGLPVSADPVTPTIDTPSATLDAVDSAADLLRDYPVKGAATRLHALLSKFFKSGSK